MDQDRDTPRSHGRQPASAHLQENIAELYETIDRLHALQVDYRALIERARNNIRDSQVLEVEVNNFVRSVGWSRAG